MRTIIQRYIAAYFIIPFLVSTSFFVVFLLVFQLFRLTKLVINKGVAVSLIFELLGHIAVTFLPLAIPLSVLFATLYCLGKMSEDSEIVVMRSFGMDRFQIFKPLLLQGVLIAILTFSLNYSIIPLSKRSFKEILTGLTSKGIFADIKAGHFFTEIPRVTIFADGVAEEGKVLNNVFINTLDRDGLKEKVIFARKGVINKKNPLEDDTVDSSLRMHLTDGNIVTFDKNISEETDNTEKILFKEYYFPLTEGGFDNDFAQKASMKTGPELLEILRGKNADKSLHPTDFQKVKLEFWSRINTPILCLLFIFLGYGLGIRRARGIRRNSAVQTLIILVGYYSIFFTGLSFAKKGVYPPFLAVFVPTLVIAILGRKYYRQLEWQA